MEFICIGMRNVDFKGSDGNQVNGMNLWLSYEDRNVTGVAVEKVFIPSSRISQLSFLPSVGSVCDVIYNKYGKVQDIQPV